MSGEITPGYGRMLAEAREAKGLTVAQVSDKLKLTSRQIEALEAEDYSRLPVAVFVRGFIRNYARLVDVPLDSLPAIAETAAVPTETITAHSEELRFSASPVRRWLLLPMAVFALFLNLVAALYTWLSQGEEAYVQSEPAVLTQPLPLPAPVEPVPVPPPGTETPVESPLPGIPEPVPPAPVVAPPVAPAPPPAPAVAPAIAPTVGPTTAPTAAAATGHVVLMTAEQLDSWIEAVSGDGKRYTRLLRAGEQLTLRGTPPFRLVVGNAATVRLSYDGRGIDLRPYTGDKVARLTLE